MKTYQVTLPDEFATFVDRMLAEGRWDTVDNLMLDGVMHVQEGVAFDEAMPEPEREELRRAIQVGIDQLDRGESVDGEEFMEQLLADLRPVEQPT